MSADAFDIYVDRDLTGWIDVRTRWLRRLDVEYPDVDPNASVYVKFREDGWPLCPSCGDDELWSNATHATVETIVSCLKCNWRPGEPTA